MARDDFPLTIDRRRLLASAVALLAASIVPMGSLPTRPLLWPFNSLPPRMKPSPRISVRRRLG